MAKEKKDEKQEEVVQVPKYTKEQLLNAKKYSNRKDAIQAVIPDDFYGSIADADALFNNFMKGKVN